MGWEKLLGSGMRDNRNRNGKQEQALSWGDVGVTLVVWWGILGMRYRWWGDSRGLGGTLKARYIPTTGRLNGDKKLIP